jgi:5-methyltetrahydrofolate--homocysteine methyltransferase
VKIDPKYKQPVIHVRDASRCVNVLNDLLSEKRSAAYTGKVSEKYTELRRKHESRQSARDLISIEEARQNKVDAVIQASDIVKPKNLGIWQFDDISISEIRNYIDWTFFFHAWRVPGKYPAIFDDPVKGEEAKKLYRDALEMLDMIVERDMLRAKGVVGLFPANSRGDDIEIYHPDGKRNIITTFMFLRNQEKKEEGIANASLSDFVAPVDSGIMDYMGGFAVTAGIGIEKWVKHFEDNQDDYSSIMLKICADRLAEALAEMLHEKVRKEVWGYSPGECNSPGELLKESYQGIRPAPGYPACPDHSEKRKLFNLLDAEKKAGISLTENYAMYPAASVSGYYFMHPFSRYFNLGKIMKDQVIDYASRKGISIAEAEKLLAPNLGYK